MLKNLLIFTLINVISKTINATSTYSDPLVVPGKTVFTHLFEWKWTDVANECERFLGPKGYAAVQISPPNEHVLLDEPFRPWYQRYQPVSYKLISRSGNESQFANMVSRCNAVGVRVYIDAVINHMSASYKTPNNYKSSGGSFFNPNEKYYPEVPYGKNDFNDNKCQSKSGEIEDWNDPHQIRYCKLVGLNDLATDTNYVRRKIADYLNKMIDLGVAGFRIDGSKHIHPEDLQIIFSMVKNVREDIFGLNRRPFIYHEIIDMGSEIIKNKDYIHLGRITEFKYGFNLAEAILKLNGQLTKNLRQLNENMGFLNGEDAIVFVDDHDTQRNEGMRKDTGLKMLSFDDGRPYKIATIFMLAWPYGLVQILSSYKLNAERLWEGPPSDKNGNTIDVIINEDGGCDNGWICEHRWRAIANMVVFRNVALFDPIENWWDNWNNQIAFSRGNKGFIAINNEDKTEMNETLNTGMPSGIYCDIISGDKLNLNNNVNECSGRKIFVDSNGMANVFISHLDEYPIIAIHNFSRIK